MDEEVVDFYENLNLKEYSKKYFLNRVDWLIVLMVMVAFYAIIVFIQVRK